MTTASATTERTSQFLGVRRSNDHQSWCLLNWKLPKPNLKKKEWKDENLSFFGVGKSLGVKLLNVQGVSWYAHVLFQTLGVGSESSDHQKITNPKSIKVGMIYVYNVVCLVFNHQPQHAPTIFHPLTPKQKHTRWTTTVTPTKVVMFPNLPPTHIFQHPRFGWKNSSVSSCRWRTPCTIMPPSGGCSKTYAPPSHVCWISPVNKTFLRLRPTKGSKSSTRLVWLEEVGRVPSSQDERFSG